MFGHAVVKELGRREAQVIMDILCGFHIRLPKCQVLSILFLACSQSGRLNSQSRSVFPQISLVLHCQPVLALRKATTVEYIPGERVEKGSCFDLSELVFVMVGTKQMAIYIYEVLLWFCHVYAFSILYSLFDD